MPEPTLERPPLSAALVHNFYTLLERRDWAAVRKHVADDLLYEVPQTREQVRGGDAWVRFCIEFPGDWHLAVDRVVVDPVAREAAVTVHATLDGEPAANLAFLSFDERGLVVRFVDWWPEPYDPPTGRPLVVERT